MKSYSYPNPQGRACPILEHLLLPPDLDLRLDAITPRENVIMLTVTAIAERVNCPCCTQPSAAIHSRYQRRVADLPLVGVRVQLNLQVRKFFCRNQDCSRKIFTERLTPFVKAYARRSTRLRDTLEQLALDLGGEGSARLATQQGMPISHDSLLRWTRRRPESEVNTPPPTATPQPLRIDTASEGYSCSNGVCTFPSGNVGTSYAAPITSSGGQGPTPYIWSVVGGSLPAGLSLTPSYGVYSAYVYGTPTTVQTSTFTLQVRDGVGDTAQQAFTLTINPPAPLVITLPGSTANSGTVGTAYNQNLFASGGVQPNTWSITGGQLPPGLQVSKLSNGGNAIDGTPTTAGTFNFILTVTDSQGTQTSEQSSITIN